LWQVVQDVWYLREKAGIAEDFGTDANIPHKTVTTAATLTMTPAFQARRFMTKSLLVSRYK
jgi:hypothetical protein